VVLGHFVTKGNETFSDELRDHLLKVEAAIQATKPILARQDYERNRRTVVVIAFMDQVIEHHEAMLSLIMHDMIGSAFALARSTVEGVYRGIWLNCCATDAEVERFVRKDEIDLSMAQLAEAIDTRLAANLKDLHKPFQFFQDMKKNAWDVLNSYTHTGMMQVSRRFTNGELKVAYTDEQVIEITMLVTLEERIL
jgi:hypothetical protein